MSEHTYVRDLGHTRQWGPLRPLPLLPFQYFPKWQQAQLVEQNNRFWNSHHINVVIQQYWVGPIGAPLQCRGGTRQLPCLPVPLLCLWHWTCALGSCSLLWQEAVCAACVIRVRSFGGLRLCGCWHTLALLHKQHAHKCVASAAVGRAHLIKKCARGDNMFIAHFLETESWEGSENIPSLISHSVLPEPYSG